MEAYFSLLLMLIKEGVTYRQTNFNRFWENSFIFYVQKKEMTCIVKSIINKMHLEYEASQQTDWFINNSKWCFRIMNEIELSFRTFSTAVENCKNL